VTPSDRMPQRAWLIASIGIARQSIGNVDGLTLTGLDGASSTRSEAGPLDVAGFTGLPMGHVATECHRTVGPIPGAASAAATASASDGWAPPPALKTPRCLVDPY
jgi:hypothetical protein